MITIESLMEPGLNGLEFADNAHLFQWMGELLYSSDPVPGESQNAVPQKDIRDWGYLHTATGRSDGFVDRSVGVSTHIPVKDVAIRDEVLPTRRRTERRIPGDIKASPLRSNKAAMFDAANQTAQATQAENPFLVELNILLNYEEPTQSEDSFYAGVEWALQVATVESIGFKLIQLPILLSLKVDAACKMAIAHMRQRGDLDDMLKDLDRKHYSHVDRQVQEKLDLIRAEWERWALAAAVPVMSPDGAAVCKHLTLVNLATACVAKQRLRAIACDVFSFGNGAVAARQGLAKYSTLNDVSP